MMKVRTFDWCRRAAVKDTTGHIDNSGIRDEDGARSPQRRCKRRAAEPTDQIDQRINRSKCNLDWTRDNGM